MGRSICSLGAGSILALALSSSPAMADDKAAELTPKSNWYASLKDGSCRLGRTFTDGTREYLLMFEQWGPDPGFGITVAGPRFRAFASGDEVQLTYFDGQEPRTIRPFKTKSDDYVFALSEVSAGLTPSITEDEDEAGEKATGSLEEGEGETGLDAIDTDYAAQARFVAVEQRGHKVTFKTGSLKDPLAVLNQCSEQILVSWGLDLEKHQTASRRVVLKNAEELSGRMVRNWPSDALKTGRTNGTMNVRVMVNSEGKIGECLITNTDATALMQRSTCNSMASGKYEPALDFDGNPMDSYYITRVRYRTVG